jgi:hypothetical protein
MSVEAVISTQVIDTTSVGRSLMTAVNAAAARTAADAQVTLVSGTNIKTVNSTSLLGSGDITVGLSGTGSVDNAALRADGTGGATLQNSAWIIADNLTASPNNTVNHACLEATGGTTNVSVSIKPKGSGAFCLSPPDGTATGGNVRGANSVDLQTARLANTQVASGSVAFAAGGYNTCGGNEAPVTIGMFCTTSGYTPIALGYNCTVSGGFGQGNIAMGKGATANYSAEPQATAIGTNVSATSAATRATGSRAVADRMSMTAHANGMFAAAGDAQLVDFQARRVTTSAVATELFLDGSSTRLTIPSGKVLSALVRVVGVKSDGSEVIKFLRDVTIKNVGGTTSLEAAIVTVGTDINVSGATLDLSADNTNDALTIAVTPPSGTWRWHAVVECANEIAYGT